MFLILDSSYEEILDCLPYQPFLLKPNEEELQEWFHTEVQTKDDYIFTDKITEAGSQKYFTFFR